MLGIQLVRCCKTRSPNTEARALYMCCIATMCVLPSIATFRPAGLRPLPAVPFASHASADAEAMGCCIPHSLQLRALSTAAAWKLQRTTAAVGCIILACSCATILRSASAANDWPGMQRIILILLLLIIIITIVIQ
jgi:hypothetical protein